MFGAYGIGLFLLGPCLTAIAATYRVSIATTGMLFAAFSIGFLLCVFPFGVLYERVSKKWLLAGGFALMTFGMTLFALAPAVGSRPVFALAFVSLMVMAAGGSSLESAGNALMADLNPGRSALALNYAHALLAVGAVLGPWMAGQLMQAGLSWQVPYLIAAGCCLVVLLVLLFQPEPVISHSDEMTLPALRRVAGKSIVWIAFAGITLYVAAETGIVGWVPAFMERSLNASKAGASGSVSLFWLAMTAGRLLCTALASLIRPQTFVVLLSAGGAIASAGIAASRSPAMCYMFVALSGLLLSGIFAMVLAHAGAILGGRLGAAFGIIISGIAVGSMIIPPGMGWLAEAAGMRLALLAPAVALAATAVLYLPFALKRASHKSDPCASQVLPPP